MNGAHGRGSGVDVVGNAGGYHVIGDERDRIDSVGAGTDSVDLARGDYCCANRSRSPENNLYMRGVISKRILFANSMGIPCQLAYDKQYPETS